MNKLYVPTSLGELVDKLTILEIKSDKFKGSPLKNVEKELSLLKSILFGLKLDINKDLINELKKINIKLWNIEDSIRECERKKIFNDNFILLARSVYKFNDERASIKRKINLTYGSDLIEEKSYSEY